MTDQYEIPCTCHPSEAPVPCQHKYAYSDCKIAQLQADYANASAEAAACIKFLECELGWSDFREEMLGDTESGKNIAKLQAFLKERGGHGAKFLADYNASQQTVREEKERADGNWAALERVKRKWESTCSERDELQQTVRELRQQMDMLIGKPDAVHLGAQAAVTALRQCQATVVERDEMRSQLDRALSELADARKDTERLNWLEKAPKIGSILWRGVAELGWVALTFPRTARTAREAIDDARAATETKSG